MSSNLEIFSGLHAASTPLLLPNAWDAASAALLQESGARAIGTSSAALAWSLGYQDGGVLPRAELLAAVARIMRVTRVPLTVDVEDGYSTDPREVATLVAQLVDLGVVGINIEDGTEHPQVLAAKIEAVRQRLSPTQLFINARTDVYLRTLVPVGAEIEEVLARAQRYQAAGASGLFVPGLARTHAVVQLSAQTELVVNLLALPDMPPVPDLFAAGMRRISLGTALFKAAYAVAQTRSHSFVGAGTLDGLFTADMGNLAMDDLIGSSVA